METKEKCIERTLGDGIDNSLFALNENSSKILDIKLNVKPCSNILKTLKPVEPKGPVINLMPKYVPSTKKQVKYLTMKPKDPKFVPYEPYKGAVYPIIPKAKTPPKSTPKNKDLDIQDLVLQLAEMRSMDMNKAKTEALDKDKPSIPKTQWEEEKIAYENDIKNLRETNAHLENQLKFQAQVNSELKTLLVAAVGEDLETRVQHLTEAKLLLARELLNSVYSLTSHQEHTEWLSGQCEVWRSKFLASSLMVEELARWKSALTNKINELQENVKELLEERGIVRNNAVRTYDNLKQVEKSINTPNERSPLKNINILHLSAELHSQSENIANKLVSDFDKLNRISCEDIQSLPGSTPAETSALKILTNPVVLIPKPDMVCNAVMGAAFSLGKAKMFLQHPTSHATCCAHCKGEVQDI